MRRSEESTLQLSRNKLFDVSPTSLRGSRLSDEVEGENPRAIFFSVAPKLSSSLLLTVRVPSRNSNFLFPGACHLFPEFLLAQTLLTPPHCFPCRNSIFSIFYSTQHPLKVRRSEESALQVSRNKLFDVSLTSLRGSRLSVRRKEKTREPSFFCRAQTLLLTPPHCQNPFSLVGAPIFYSTHTIP